MKKLVFLFCLVFSPLALLCVSGHVGNPELDKLNGSEALVAPETKTAKEELPCDSLAIAIRTLSDWQVASGSYYDPKDTLQTKPECDGKGAFERMVQSGSIALGSSFTKFFVNKKKEMEVLIETNLKVVTPFGKGIFRLDDKMGKSYSIDGNYFLDFHEENLTKELILTGRFKVLFRIYEIREI